MNKIASISSQLAFLGASLLTSGCAGTATYANMLQNSGYIRVEEPDRPDHDYKFYVSNFEDIGFDGNLQSDRKKVIEAYLIPECKSVAIVDETSIPLGEWPLGGKKVQYITRVKCLRT